MKKYFKSIEKKHYFLLCFVFSFFLFCVFKTSSFKNYLADISVLFTPSSPLLETPEPFKTALHSPFIPQTPIGPLENSATIANILANGRLKPFVIINPGENIQSAIDASLEDTIFILKKGVHRSILGPNELGQQYIHAVAGTTTLAWFDGIHIKPKSGDVFIGEQGAILSGAKLLNSATDNIHLFKQKGNFWVLENQYQEGNAPQKMECRSYQCMHPENLFMDNQFVDTIDTLKSMRAQSPLSLLLSHQRKGEKRWYFDYKKNAIYINFDPADHTIETSVASYAFVNPFANNVTISNLIIEKYATPTHFSAIISGNRPTQHSQTWTITNNEIRLIHSDGLNPSDRSIIAHNFIHHNGNAGISGEGNYVVIENNELSYNNILNNEIDYGAAGLKMCESRNITLRHNYVHHNYAHGLWLDCNVVDALYEDNLVEYNSANGIFFEVSSHAIIRNNIARYNGYAKKGGSGIYISTSNNVLVEHNTTIQNYSGGIHLSDALRADRPLPEGLSLITVQNNMIDMSTSLPSSNVHRYSGFSKDKEIKNEEFTKKHNRFIHNTYLVDSQNEKRWRFLLPYTNLSFKEWQEFGMDNDSILMTKQTSQESKNTSSQ